MSESGQQRLALEPYIFVDRSGYHSHSYEDISQYDYDSSLGTNIEATVVVKWDNQRDHDDNLRALGRVGWNVGQGNALAPSPRSRHRYYGGYILRAVLDSDVLSQENVVAQPCLQPTGAAIRADGATAYACGNHLVLTPDGDVSDASKVIENPMFARLHSVAFNGSGERLLTASSALDMLYELQIKDGDVVWSMDLWTETPYNKNILGQSFYRIQSAETTGFLLNPTSFELKDNEQLRDADCVIDNPGVYNGLGLVTALAPVFINAIDYESDAVLLATSFARGEAWRIDREQRRVEILAKDLGRPHGLHVNRATGGYLVSDTLKEQVLFLDAELEHKQILDLSKLTGRKEGLGNSRWLQYTTELRSGVYCAAMTSRQKLTLFDPTNKVRRDIELDPNWGIQMVIPTNR